MARLDIDLDDTPVPVAVFDYEAEYQRAEPDVGIMSGGWAVSGEIEDWKIGSLHLSRAQMVQAFGDQYVAQIEADAEEKAMRAASEEAEASALDYGDYLYELRRDRIAAE